MHDWETLLFTQIEIGYWGLLQQGRNWNCPLVLSSPIGVSVVVAAKQEGGYLNTVTTCTSDHYTLQTMSVWLLSGVSFSFSLSWTYNGETVNMHTHPNYIPLICIHLPSIHHTCDPVSPDTSSINILSTVNSTTQYQIGITYNTGSINAVSGTDMSLPIFSALNGTSAASVSSVRRVRGYLFYFIPVVCCL